MLLVHGSVDNHDLRFYGTHRKALHAAVMHQHEHFQLELVYYREIRDCVAVDYLCLAQLGQCSNFVKLVLLHRCVD